MVGGRVQRDLRAPAGWMVNSPYAANLQGVGIHHDDVARGAVGMVDFAASRSKFDVLQFVRGDRQFLDELAWCWAWLAPFG